MTGTSVVGIVVGFVAVIVILVIILGVVIGVLIARNRRYQLSFENEQFPTSSMTSQLLNPEYEIPTAQCPAYVPTSQQRERVEEGVYEDTILVK